MSCATAAGYAVLSGISFEQLVWFCTRAFIERDDESLDVLDEQRIAGVYRRLEETKVAIDRLCSSTDDEFRKRADEDLERARRSDEQTCATWKAENVIFDAMLQKIEAWQPPPSVPPEIKAYLLEQIRCSKTDPDRWLPNTSWSTRGRTREQEIADLRIDLERDLRTLVALEGRLAERQAWVRDLEAAVPRPANFDPPGSK